MDNKTRKNTRKNQRKIKSMVRAKGTLATAPIVFVAHKNGKKRDEADVAAEQMARNLNEKLNRLAESAKGRIQFIPATKDEVARIVIPPDLDEEIRKSIHLSDFLPVRASA